MTNFLMSFLLICASYFDIKKFEVPLLIQILMFILTVITANIKMWIVPLIIFVVICCVYTKINLIGGADIKILLILMAFFGNMFPYILFFSTLLALLFIFIKKCKRIPFVPFICIGEILCLILKNYLLI